MSALLALGGSLPEPARLADLCAGMTTVVAADGAAIELLAAGIPVAAVIGDLDSIGDHRAEVEAAGATIVEEPSQEMGDFEKALLWLREQGMSHVRIVGFDGGMLDHTLNNASILARYARFFRLEIISGDAIARTVIDSLTLQSAPGERVSLITLPRARVTTSQMEWALHDEVLETGVREGASNRATGTAAAVIVHEGVLLVVHFPGVKR